MSPNKRQTAHYLRLSKDDERDGDSNSIINQRNFLNKYSQQNGFKNIIEFVDDGVSGTVFRRPGLDALIEEVKRGNIATVIVKDQSRIGRDVLEVGLLKRTFEENSVRFIAAADNLDTSTGFDIMSVFRDVFNEYYVADVSKKIRAVKRSNALSGKANNRPPYGYKIIEGGTHNDWEIDEYAAGIVREIFKRFIAGEGSHSISRHLHYSGHLPPIEYYRKRTGVPIKGDCTWSTHGVIRILEGEFYTGVLVSQKQTTVSYKNHKTIIRPPEEWIITQNHHPPIIDNETFDLVKKLLLEGKKTHTKI